MLLCHFFLYLRASTRLLSSHFFLRGVVVGKERRGFANPSNDSLKAPDNTEYTILDTFFRRLPDIDDAAAACFPPPPKGRY
jgi:hypothetical protein